MSDSENGYSLPPLAVKLNTLFKVIRRPDGREWSAEAVSSELAERGERISGVYIHMLRSGRKDNPTKKHLEALARFFGVDVSYFYDDSLTQGAIEYELKLNGAMVNPSIRKIALHADGLSQEALDRVLDILYYARRVEGLAAIEPLDQ